MLPQPPLWLILISFVCVLGPLVFFHELGHYLVARLFGIPAETFSIGFGHEIVGWTDRQGTRWKVAWLPLGGYVKFVGDMTPASNPGDIEQIPPEMRDRAFQLRPVWQRFLVVLAGPLANFVLAIAIFAAFFTDGWNARDEQCGRSSAARKRGRTSGNPAGRPHPSGRRSRYADLRRYFGHCAAAPRGADGRARRSSRDNVAAPARHSDGRRT